MSYSLRVRWIGWPPSLTVRRVGSTWICAMEGGVSSLSSTRRTVNKGGQPIHLTRKEYDILFYLMTHAGRAVTYGKLLTSVWGPDYRQEVDYLRTFVRQLRKKIENDPSDPKYLLTDAYVGYRFAEVPATCEGPASDAH